MKIYLAGVPGAGASNRQAKRYIKGTKIDKFMISYSDLLYNKRGDLLRFTELTKLIKKNKEK